MRFLHTSDWHLGRTFHGSSLLAEQELAMNRVVEAAQEHGVDAVLIAGDVYDRALPAVDVVELFDRTLARLVELGVSVVVTSGNHDSAVRLGFGGRLMEAAGVHLRTRVEDIATPVVLSGDEEDVLVYGLPYLEPRMVAAALQVEEGGHTPIVRAAMKRVLDDAAARASGGGRPQRVVVMAHVFAAGGEASESERSLAVGELDRVPATLFEGVDYAALGHLHGPQAPLPHVRYSGSPLPYSFSEAEQRKVGLIVDLEPGQAARVTELAWEPPRALARLRGTIEHVLADPDLDWAQEAWCQFILTDTHRPERPMERLRERFPNTLVLRWEPEGRDAQAPVGYRERVHRDAQDPVKVATGFIEHVRDRPVNADEGALLESFVRAAHVEEASK